VPNILLALQIYGKYHDLLNVKGKYQEDKWGADVADCQGNSQRLAINTVAATTVAL